MRCVQPVQVQSQICNVQYEEVESCPICKFAIKPEFLCARGFPLPEGGGRFAFTFLCKHCYHPFIAVYNSYSASGNVATSLLFCEPNRPEKRSFDQKLEALSPQFVKIFNEAEAAESSGLHEIAGMGYRKSLEFLTKDFCIHQKPDDAEKIKNLSLARCIAEYIEQPAIAGLANRSAWIGNDETHYVRKQPDLDVSVMKEFIEAMVYFVSMSLVAESASSIPPAGGSPAKN